MQPNDIPSLGDILVDGTRSWKRDAFCLLPLLGLAYCAGDRSTEEVQEVREVEPMTAIVEKVTGETPLQTCEQRYGVPSNLCSDLRVGRREIEIPLE